MHGGEMVKVAIVQCVGPVTDEKVNKIKNSLSAVLPRNKIMVVPEDFQITLCRKGA